MRMLPTITPYLRRIDSRPRVALAHVPPLGWGEATRRLELGQVLTMVHRVPDAIYFVRVREGSLVRGAIPKKCPRAHLDGTPRSTSFRITLGRQDTESPGPSPCVHVAPGQRGSYHVATAEVTRSDVRKGCRTKGPPPLHALAVVEVLHLVIANFRACARGRIAVLMRCGQE